ncbi:hypothetical protein, partial [Pseudoalteromonas ruthenica]|uniref:hypothetical protein n=1 Tax=Pseudoalteromonas ruthenica TaxID=151081 RepID=UPI001BB20A55
QCFTEEVRIQCSEFTSLFCLPDEGQDPEQSLIIVPTGLILITLMKNYTIAQFLAFRLLALLMLCD